jgi:anti-sigma-K factor RskA
MIPVAFLGGLSAGRWWTVAVIAVAWTVIVAVFADCDLACAPLAAVLGAANSAVGVAVHRVVRLGTRSVRNIKPD